MIMKCITKLLLSALVGAMWTIKAEDSDLTGYQKVERKEQISLIQNPDFEAVEQGWKLKPGFSIEKHGGLNGTTGLRYERRQPKSYHLVSRGVPISPNKFYRFGVWVKTENVTGGRGGATIAMEFMKDDGTGKKVFRSGQYPRGVSGTSDWTWVSDVVRAPADAVGAHITLYMYREATGVAWFDDISVQELDGNLWSLHAVVPFGRIVNGKIPVRVAYDGKGLPAGDWAVQLNISKAKIAIRKTAAEEIEFSLPELPSGQYDAELMILDRSKKLIVFSTIIPFNVPASTMEGKVMIDKLGRLLVNGELFMPIGIFGSSLDPKMLDLLKESGFNCTLPYGSMGLKPSPEATVSREQIAKAVNMAAEKGVEITPQAARALSLITQAMDVAGEKGIKVIFNLKDVGSPQAHGFDAWHGIKDAKAITTAVVNQLKDHPAMLAWYTADEAPPSHIPRLTTMRQLCNAIDQNHPVYGVFYQYKELPSYGTAFDIIGIDPYPLSGNTLKSAVYAMEQAKRTGLPIWSVPQIFNWGIFKAAEKSNPNPSEEKMRSLILLEAAMGAKGFILYSYFDLRPPRAASGNFEKEWPKVKNLVAMLKKLEPYILSDHPAKILIKQQVVAAELQNNSGKRVVIFCSVGPGKCEADLILDGEFHSEYGRSVRKNGKWHFSGEDISSDILFEK